MSGTILAENSAMLAALQVRLLRRAVVVAGGTAELSFRLGVEEHTLGLWLAGRATMPQEHFLVIVDLVLDDDIARAAHDRRREPRQAGANPALRR